jgi:hypothetical protein
MEQIFSYSRKEAIEDGVLVDVTKLASEAGIKYPVAMTSEVFETIDPSKLDKEIGQSLDGRLWDLFTMFKLATRQGGSEIKFNFIVHKINPETNRRKKDYVELKAVCGPGDTTEPCVTIMFPSQD